MNKERDYAQDLAEIRSMMERSTKFISLSGWAGIMAGVYALAGAYIIYEVFNFNPNQLVYSAEAVSRAVVWKIIVLGVIMLLSALSTAIYLSWNKAAKNGEKAWSFSSRRLITHMAVPLLAGGALICILIAKNALGLIAPLSLVFYGISLYNGSKFTIDEVKYLGAFQILLGILSTWYIEYSLIIWAMGFGVVHILYGIYLHMKYER